MTLTIDFVSLILGMFVGTYVVSMAVVRLYYDQRWDNAFGAGWKAGREYGEKERKGNGDEQNT